MSFTDDDLKRWEEFSKNDINGAYHIDMDGLKSLLARLEAAERFRFHGRDNGCRWVDINEMAIVCDCGGADRDFQAWRRACGVK